ncbi:mucin-15 [Nerophis ophidion]|uniref:mucin-15 n=1 Tax=Nerophis ophidion TaxID=159077 RepID=UPI002ADF5C1D|nr:mucin-15 [Nerophis ophidion]XP_061743320.1 mucin-15 [Nerophis ophidion]XP_061743321.1 mucin-15 [Nerophis ophidion]
MGLHLKFTVHLLLLVHTFNLASLQTSTQSPKPTIDRNWLRGEIFNATDPPRPTIDKSWLREEVFNATDPPRPTIDKSWLREEVFNATDPPRPTIDKSWLREQIADAEEEGQNEQPGDVSPTESSNDLGPVVPNDGDHVDSQEQGENKTSDDQSVAITTEPPTSSKASQDQPELTNRTGNFTNGESSQTNITGNEELDNSTTTPMIPPSDPIDGNSTTVPDFTNPTLVNTTTLSPGIINPNENMTTVNNTESTNATEPATTTVTTTTTTEMNDTSATPSSTEVLPTDPAEFFPEMTTTVAPETPEANLDDKQASSGSSSERGFASETSKRREAWGAVLGTAVVVSVVGLVAYVVLKRKHQNGFSHRKLVEVFPTEPVLRLDTSEPLDLNYGGSAYYNPGLQGDSIQMSNYPRHKAQ